jgi:hypothetical protein
VLGRVRLVVVALLALVLATPACGGDDNGDAAQPLALHQRVARSGDIENYEPGGGGRLETEEDVAERFSAIFASPTDPARDELVSRLEQAGFVAGYDRGLRESEGGDGESVVARVGSAGGAKAIVDWIFRQALKPCPGVCDVQIQTVEASDIPGARAIHRFRAKTSEQGQPFEIYLVTFADGPFVYGIAVGGPPKSIEESNFVHAAERLYDRVKGHPPA